MNEQKFIRSQFLRHIIKNVAILTGILVLFGIMMFTLVKEVTFSNVNNNLIEASKKVESNFKIEQKLIEVLQQKFKAYEIITNTDNQRIIGIIRDKNGQIFEEDKVTKMYGNDILKIKFPKVDEKEIYKISSENKHYRAINVKLDNEKIKDVYVQLLIDVESEIDLVDLYFQIITYTILAGIIISIFASIVMAKNTMNPIIDMVKRQNEFVQNVSHELRTPLTIIQAKQELLLQEPNAKVIDKVEDIGASLKETKRLGKLIKDLLVLSRADNKEIELKKENVDIDEFIKNFSKTYQDIIELENKKLEVNLNYNKTASIDTNRIYQVMVILIDNAIKYTEPGDSIIINTYSKDNKCVIEVRDTGIGINDESIKRIFDRFYREDKARNRETGGSGLGLSIADMIVTAHSGTITAAHNGNDGTVFTLKLPR